MQISKVLLLPTNQLFLDFEDEAPLNIGPNLTYSLLSTSIVDNGTQVDFDEPPSPIQLDKSTQTEMSSFPKSREMQKLK